MKRRESFKMFLCPRCSTWINLCFYRFQLPAGGAGGTGDADSAGIGEPFGPN